MTVTVEMLAAGNGDALWIEWSDSAGPHRILIDGGPGKSYPALRRRIEQLPAGERRFDLFVISHIDTDHIDGAITLLMDDLGIEFGDIWFNGRNHLDRPYSRTPGNRYLGGVEGQVLSAILDRPELAWNQAFAGRSVVIGRRSFPEIPIGDLTLTLVSPGAEQLQRLGSKWSHDVGKALQNLELVADGEDEEEVAEAIRSGGFETARRLFEARLRKRLEPPAGWEPSGEEGRFLGDSSRPNGSSIAFLLEDAARRKGALFAADAHAKVLNDSLRRLRLDRGLAKLPLWAYKVSHHGSKANINKTLVAKLDCDAYLFSSNGEGHGHPHAETIEMILGAERERGRHPHLYFNYLSGETEPWADPARGHGRDYTAHYPPAGRGDHGLAVDLPLLESTD